MPVSRRKFLQAVGLSSLGAVIFKACGFADREILVESPVELPEDLVSGTDNWYASTCRQCQAGCGVVTRVMEGRAKKLEGNPNHPLNRGKLCVRGQAGVQALYNPDRIEGPMRRSSPAGQLEKIPGTDRGAWLDAMDELMGRLRGVSGEQVLLVTEPLKGQMARVTRRFIDSLGIQHISYESMERDANLRTAIRDVFGQETLPEFDIENTKFLMGFGVDLLETWLSTVRYNRGYGAFRQGQAGETKSLRDRGTFVQVDSRFSMTAANADRWVPIKPGMEGNLALSMAYVIIREGMAPEATVNALTNGQGYSWLQAFAPENIEAQVGVEASRIVELARQFASERPSLAIGGNSAGAHTNGTFNLMAIYSLNFLVGSVGSNGPLLFNPVPLIPGQENALPRATFRDWQSTVERIDRGDFKVLMVRGVNPVHGTPEVAGFQNALDKVDYAVSFSSFMDDTTARADLVLPDHTYLESWGDEVPDPSPGYEMVSYQQPVVRPIFNTRAFGDQLIDIADQTGSPLPWPTFKDALREGAQEIQRLGRGSVQSSDFEVFWNGLLQRGVWYDLDAKPETRAEPKPLPTEPVLPIFSSSPPGDGFHLILYPSLALTDGKGANLPWLQATPDPMTTVVWETWVDISLRDAENLSVKTNDILEIRSIYGSVEVPAYVNRGTPPGTISMPVGQGHNDFGRYAKGRGANPLSLLAPFTDGHTGALAWNATRVKVTKAVGNKTLPKFEGAVEALPAPTTELVQVVHKS